ncbi:ly6/PLAUR domain-containing protein 3 [Tachyglossus aculeatus]|uniref:ly6/PLAUR domain-containing protein 3 n=1 Tax=Tachyglossus aculeatus TaxID=9261 RepID=UPI0018F41C05|nr:ly6/PLAUR domain-containing protein 3 [Tachyglossus aculeatus]
MHSVELLGRGMHSRWMHVLGPALLLLQLLRGAFALECYSCVQKGDSGCAPANLKTVKCPAGTEVCTEAVGAVETIHGQFSLAVKGCGSGLPGKNDRGLDLHGIMGFLQLLQCDRDRCNGQLNLTTTPLNPAGNESGQEANGAECYSCLGQSREACAGNAAPLAKCYDAGGQEYRGCFDGNVTLTAANTTVSLPVRGCVRDRDCTRDGAGNSGFTLTGSCCEGPRCNADLRNKTYFAPRIPPLVVLPVPRPTGTGTTRPSGTPAAPGPATKPPAGATTQKRPEKTSEKAPEKTTSGKTPQGGSSPTTMEPVGSEEEVDHVHDHGHDGHPAGGRPVGHQDRSGASQHPSKGGAGAQYPTKEWAKVPTPPKGGAGVRGSGVGLSLALLAALTLL